MCLFRAGIKVSAGTVHELAESLRGRHERNGTRRLLCPLSQAVKTGNARLRYWKVLATELRCRRERCTALAKAVLALHDMEHDPFAALRAA